MSEASEPSRSEGAEGGESKPDRDTDRHEGVPAAENAVEGSPMIVATGLTKYYGSRAAIRDLSFTIDQGEIVGFLGLNGAGKTTTLRILSCLLVPSAGRVTVAGLDVIESPHEIRKRIGYLPEVPPLYHEMTVRAFLDFAARLRGVDGSQVGRRVEAVIEVTRTREVGDQVIGTLSAGYRQRVGIAQAVVHEPDLLILDEPFAGLDPVQTVEMREMIRGLGGRHTVLLSSHMLSQIHATCDRILLIRDGRIVAQGTEAELAATLPVRAERFELELRGGREAVAAALEAVEGVTSHEAVDVDEGLLKVVVEATLDVREASVEALVKGGVGVRSVERLLPELETVFVELARAKGEEVAP